MNDTQKTLDEIAAALIAGNLSREQQNAMGRDLAEIGIVYRRAQRTLDELTQESAEQERLDHRRHVEEQMAAARRLGLKVAPAIADEGERVLAFPVRGRFAESAAS